MKQLGMRLPMMLIFAACWLPAQDATITLGLGDPAAKPQGPTDCKPCIVGTGSGIPGHEGSWSNNAVLYVSVGASNTTIPLARMDFWGNDTNTEIIFTPAGNRNDQLFFVGNNATLSNKGRVGTAKLLWGTGAFTHVTGGTLSYDYSCVGDVCYDGSGTPGPYTYTFQLTGSGSFTIPPRAAVEEAVPALYPGIVQQMVTNTKNTTQTVFMGGDPNNPFGDHSVHAHASSPGAGGTMTILPPWQISAATYSVAAACPNLPSGCWITIPEGTGALPAFTSVPVTATIDPGTLGPGYYPANISTTLTPSDGSPPATTVVPMNLMVTNGAQLLQLSETGIQFQALGGSAPQAAPHSILVSSSGASFSYQATASTLSGGNWLSVSPASGTASFTAPGSVGIQTNAAGMAPGSYFGKVDIAAPGQVGSPQSVEVELTVGPGGPVPILSATGLVFVTAQNVNPTPQTVTLSTLSSTPVSITAAVDADSNQTWLAVSASSTTLQAGVPGTAQVTVSATGVAPGAYTATFYVQATATGANYPISVVFIVTPAVGACTPTQLLPVLTNLSTGFEFPAATPVSLQAQIVDDCGTPLNAGSVQASFGSGDSPVTMMPTGNGQWVGTWTPYAVAGGPATVALTAQASAGLQGSTSATGGTDANPGATIVNPGGIVNAAGLVAGAAVAPGEFISIFGTNLASTTVASNQYPYNASLGGTQVLLGGQALPLQFVSPGQINAIVPYGTPVNGFQSLLIQNNNAYSLLESVVVATANPAVFTLSQSGQGAGAIIVLKGDGSQFINTSTAPASVGDILEIYCAGLGPVSPTVADGVAAPLLTLSRTVNPVSVIIGGQPAQVLFAGLAPGFAGLYQVNVVVPPGVAAGASVSLIVTEAGSSSPAVTVAIH
jgi:uncharacterized protein (TIGR03437 family)